VKIATYVFLLSWFFLPGSIQAQSLPDVKPGMNSEISASVARVGSQPRTGREPNRPAPAQQFVCGQKVPLDECRKEAAVLRNVLMKYGAHELGEWRWMLVRSEYWKLFLAGRGFSSNVPALTSLDARVTFFDEALVAGAPERFSELMDVWHLDRDDLLDLAVRHELGHAFCNDESERNADLAARRLEKGKPLACKGSDKLSSSKQRK
jgi:hypothetical protein